MEPETGAAPKVQEAEYWSLRSPHAGYKGRPFTLWYTDNTGKSTFRETWDSEEAERLVEESSVWEKHFRAQRLPEQHEEQEDALRTPTNAYEQRDDIGAYGVYHGELGRKTQGERSPPPCLRIHRA